MMDPDITIIPEIPTARDTATTREAALIHGAETLREREPGMEALREAEPIHGAETLREREPGMEALREAEPTHGAGTLRETEHGREMPPEPAMEPGYITRRLKQKEKRLCK